MVVRYEQHDINVSVCENADEALASAMNELGTAAGYEEVKNATSNDHTRPTVTREKRSTHLSGNKLAHRIRLLPELKGYPDNSRAVDGYSIWNPYSQCMSLPLSYVAHMNVQQLPTNPATEVLRRRAYEKFKKSFYELIERKQKELCIPKLSSNLPSLLEKWQMDAKLEELLLHVSLFEKKQDTDKTYSERQQQQRQPVTSRSRILLTSTENISTLIVQREKGREVSWIDPILLPIPTSGISSFAQAVGEELVKCWKDRENDEKGYSHNEINSDQKQRNRSKLGKKVKTVKRAVHRLISEAVEYYEQELSSSKFRNQTSNKRPKIKRDEEKSLIIVTHYGLSYKIHPAHYEKLQRLFDRASTNHQQSDAVCFEDALFCLLCRYDMLQGAGLQAAIPGKVHDILLKHFECQLELFASPLNSRYSNFCSAFDIDRLFGSVGNFFATSVKVGCYQANPPFCEIVIANMCQRMNVLLEQSLLQKDILPLMFVIFVPVWKDSHGYQALLKSKFLTKHLVFESGHHYYAEGTQHRRKASYRLASFDTSVFLFQNEVAEEKWPISKQFQNDLRLAFTKNPQVGEESGSRGHVITDFNNDYAPSGPQVSAKLALPGTNKKALTVGEATPMEPQPSSRETEIIISSTKMKAKPKRKANKKGRNKRAFSNDKEENKAQLGILQSLGLATEKSGAADGINTTTTKSGTTNKKKRRMT